MTKPMLFLKISALLVCMSTLMMQAMYFDNRFIPLIIHPYLTVEERPSHGRVDVFMATASRAFGRIEDDLIGIPELFGFYDELDIEKSLRAVGLPVPLPAELQLLELPYNVQGKIQAQGLAFNFQQALTYWCSFGLDWFFMRVNSRQEFFFKKSDSSLLTVPEQEEIENARREMQEMV